MSKITLALHTKFVCLSDEHLYSLGQRFTRTRFSPKRVGGKKMSLCKTADGVEVFYSKANDYHFLGKEDYSDLLSRLQRLHWVIPVITENVTGKLCKFEEVGEHGIMQRTYFMPQLKYVVVLNRAKDQTFMLNTAYRVTWEWKRTKLKKRCGYI